MLVAKPFSRVPVTFGRAKPSVIQAKKNQFDTASYDRERLRLDAAARKNMEEQYAEESKMEEFSPGSGSPGAWKWAIRKRIWDALEEKNIARPPRPCHHRIPNFAGAAEAATLLASQPFFKSASIVKVNPDTPQKPIRLMVLAQGKRLLTPQPRLRTGFFSFLSRDKIPSTNDALMEATTSAGVARFGAPVGLDERFSVDLLVVGSACVTTEGARLGKGEGFAELEYGILRWMGAVDDSTLIVTTVHDEQVVDASEIPKDKLLEHDVPVDVIVTNTRVIFTNTKIKKPEGILWHKLSPQKLSQIRILRELKERIERETGHQLPTGPDEELPPVASRSPAPRRAAGGGDADLGPTTPKEESIKESNVVFLSNLDYHVNSAQIQDWIEEAVGADTVNRITMLQRGSRGRQMFVGMCVVDLSSVEVARTAVKRLNGTEMLGRKVAVRFDKFVG